MLAAFPLETAMPDSVDSRQQQNATARPARRYLPIRGNLYMLAGAGGNIAVRSDPMVC